MKRREVLQNVTLFGLSLGLSNRSSISAPDDSTDAHGRIKKAALAGLAMERRDWEQGMLAQAFLEAGEDESVIRLTKAAIASEFPTAASRCRH
jgi:hypothetical protein